MEQFPLQRVITLLSILIWHTCLHSQCKERAIRKTARQSRVNIENIRFVFLFWSCKRFLRSTAFFTNMYPTSEEWCDIGLYTLIVVIRSWRDCRSAVNLIIFMLYLALIKFPAIPSRTFLYSSSLSYQTVEYLITHYFPLIKQNRMAFSLFVM